MGLFDFGIGDILDVAKVAVGVYSAVKTTQIAEDQADLQKKEVRRRSATEAARVKRETRIRKAQLYASQGNANAILSSTASGAFGLDSSLAFGLDDLNQQTSAQVEQFNLGASNVQTQGYVDIATSLGTFAASDTGAKATTAFSDFLNPPAQTQVMPSAIGVPINSANVSNIT
jgi:hypothetical protein